MRILLVLFLEGGSGTASLLTKAGISGDTWSRERARLASLGLLSSERRRIFLRGKLKVVNSHQLTESGAETARNVVRISGSLPPLKGGAEAGQPGGSDLGETRRLLLESERTTPGKNPTENMDAYVDFLRGRELLREGDEASARQALLLFEKAVELDPSFAMAHAAVAEAHQHLGNHEYEAWDVMLSAVKASLARALELDPDLAEAHASLAVLHLNEDDLLKAEEEAKKALNLRPSLPLPYRILADAAAVRGQPAEMVRFIETAYLWDPTSPVLARLVGLMCFEAGREQKALEYWRKTEHLAPAETYRAMTDYYLSKGDMQKAREFYVKSMRLQPTNPWTIYMEGFIDAMSGDREKALLAIKKIEAARIGPAAYDYLAYVYHALGDMDRYFENLNRALEEHVLTPHFVMYSPLLARSREDPRYEALVEKLQKQTGLA